MMKFIIATNNAKKLVELERILKPLGIEAVSAKDAGVVLGEVEETGTTFLENAFIKANAAFEKTGMVLWRGFGEIGCSFVKLKQ